MKQKREYLHAQYKRYVPILVKISPDLSESDLLELLNAINSTEMDGIIATNASQYRANVENSPIAKEPGGLSGLAITELSFSALKALVAHNQSMDYISVGGIHSAAEAKRRLDEGAKLVQLYTGLVYEGPGLIKDCLEKQGLV